MSDESKHGDVARGPSRRSSIGDVARMAGMARAARKQPKKRDIPPTVLKVISGQSGQQAFAHQGNFSFMGPLWTILFFCNNVFLFVTACVFVGLSGFLTVNPLFQGGVRVAINLVLLVGYFYACLSVIGLIASTSSSKMLYVLYALGQAAGIAMELFGGIVAGVFATTISGFSFTNTTEAMATNLLFPPLNRTSFNVYTDCCINAWFPLETHNSTATYNIFATIKPEVCGNLLEQEVLTQHMCQVQYGPDHLAEWQDATIADTLASHVRTLSTAANSIAAPQFISFVFSILTILKMVKFHDDKGDEKYIRAMDSATKCHHKILAWLQHVWRGILKDPAAHDEHEAFHNYGDEAARFTSEKLSWPRVDEKNMPIRDKSSGNIIPDYQYCVRVEGTDENVVAKKVLDLISRMNQTDKITHIYPFIVKAKERPPSLMSKLKAMVLRREAEKVIVTQGFIKVGMVAKDFEAEAMSTTYKLRLDPESVHVRDFLANLDDRCRGRFDEWLDPKEVEAAGASDIAEQVRRKHAAKGDDASVINRRQKSMALHLRNDDFPTKRRPYTFLYAPYLDVEPYNPELPYLSYRIWKRTQSKFDSGDMLRLAHSVLERLPREGAGVDPGKQDDGTMVLLYPLHHLYQREKLYKEWMRWLQVPWDQPIAHIKAYFGAKIGFYYAWLSYYMMWLLAPSIIGFMVYLHQAVSGKVAVGELVVWGCFVSLWGTLFLESWKRQQATLAMEWGMSDFRDTEHKRPEFSKTAEYRASPVTGLPEERVKEGLYKMKLSLSLGAVAVAMFVVLVCVFFIFVLRVEAVKAEEAGEIQEGWGGYGVGILNAVQIQVLNAAYQKLAVSLNDWENHATDTLYESHLITKIFLFQFINSYFSLFFIAFVKRTYGSPDGFVEPCQPNAGGVPDCVGELRSQLGSIFVSRLVIGNILEVVKPYVMKKLADYQLKKAVLAGKKFGRINVSQAEAEADKEAVDVRLEYAELVIQFGYVSLFVVAFPLAPVLALVSNVVEARVDAFKMLRLSRRPEYRATDGIGQWLHILFYISKIAVLTNIGTVVFSVSSANPEDAALGVTDVALRAWVFMILVAVVLALKWLVDQVIEDVPADVSQQLARNEYLLAKHRAGAEDHLYPFLNKESMEVFNRGKLDAHADALSPRGGDSGGVAGSGSGGAATPSLGDVGRLRSQSSVGREQIHSEDNEPVVNPVDDSMVQQENPIADKAPQSA